MTYEQIILKIADSPSFETLDPELQSEILAVKKEHDDIVRKAAEEERKERAKREAELKKEMNELLCRGQWGEKVPFNRRFALCRQTNTYVSNTGSPYERKEKRDECCAVDLVRGYMAPYFGYYGVVDGQAQADTFYNEKIRPILEAKDEKELLQFLRLEYSFQINNTHAGEKFHVLDYDVEKDTGYRWCGKVSDKVIIKGKSPLMTWEEHRDALRKEFEK